jgi:very-short-patch-repair endonuclease
MGDYWHCNPRIYSKEYWHKVKNKTAQAIWSEDNKRTNILESFGYTVFCVWEIDYKNNKELVVKQLKEKIDVKIQNISSLRPSIDLKA